MRALDLRLSGLFLGIVLAAGQALADVPPPQQCDTVGAVCHNAGTDASQAGTCVSTTCPHLGPLPDGAIGTTQQPCQICQVPTSGTDAGNSSTSSSYSSGGCSVGVPAGDGLIAGGMLLVGLAFLVADRRRRRG